MNPVFVDTSALIAHLDRSDPRNPAVVAAFQRHLDDELVTHGYVVAETLAVARRRFGLDGAITLIDDLLPSLRVLVVDADLHQAALRHHRNSLPSGVSFVDQVTRSLVDRERILTVIALDPDLAQAGSTLEP